MTASPDAIDVVIKIDSQPMPGVGALVESTTFGSDGLRYQRLNVQAQLDRFNAPVYFHALADDELCGVYALDKRALLIDDQRVGAYYRGVLAVAEPSQGQGVGKLMTQSASQWLSNQAQTSPLVSYGCIDQSNARSLHVLKATGTKIGAALSMYMMYRQWPRKRCELQPLLAIHNGQLQALYNELYADCRVKDVSASKLPGFVVSDEAGIAISARVTTTSFKIMQMSPFARWSTRLFVRPFPPALKRFDPDCFRYVTFSKVLIRPGCESLWSDFVSSILATHECHFGAVYVDPRSVLFNRLQRAIPMTQFLHSTRGSIDIVSKAYNDSDNLHRHLLDNTSPVHLWPVDA